MANYQPMQNPITSTVDIGDFIAKLRQDSKNNDAKRSEFLLRQEASNRDQARLDEQMRRQGEQEKYERSNAIADVLPKLKSMVTPGSPDYDPETAISVARAKGIDLKKLDAPSPGQAPIAPEAPVRAPTEYGPRETPEIAQQSALTRSLQNAPGDQNPAAGAAEDQRQMGLAEAERQRFAKANETDQEFAGRQGDFTHQQAQFMDQQQAYNAASKRLPTYSGRALIGDVNIDPNAAVQAREDMAKRSEDAFAPLGYGKAAGALARGGTGAKPAEILPMISHLMQNDESIAARNAASEETRQFRAEQNDLARKNALNVARIAGGSRITAAGVSGGPKEDQADLAAYRHVESIVKNAWQESGGASMKKNGDMLGIARDELDSNSGSAQAGARFAIERFLRGGAATKWADEQERQRMGGIAARLSGALQTLATGRYSEGQKEAIKAEIDSAEQEYKKLVERHATALGTRLVNDPSLSNMKRTVSERYKQQMAGMGLDVPDLTTDEDNALPPIGARSVANNRRASNPIEGARSAPPP